MTNNQIIRNEAARLDPATLHAIATAHHTPDEIAAIAAACKTTDENGNEQPATVADVEIMLAADELHTFDHWKKEGMSAGSTIRTATMWGALRQTVCGTKASTFPKPKQSPVIWSFSKAPTTPPA